MNVRENITPMSTKIVVVSGLPASGKSLLARELRAALAWPLLAKDDFKEALFESLGARDRQWSKRLSLAAYVLLFRQAMELVRSGCDCILEGNFRHGVHDAQFAALAALGAHFVQAHCHAPPHILARRFRERIPSRHPGHLDLETVDEITTELLQAQQQPLVIGGMVIDCANATSSPRWAKTTVGRVLDALQLN